MTLDNQKLHSVSIIRTLNINIIARILLCHCWRAAGTAMIHMVCLIRSWFMWQDYCSTRIDLYKVPFSCIRRNTFELLLKLLSSLGIVQLEMKLVVVRSRRSWVWSQSRSGSLCGVCMLSPFSPGAPISCHGPG